jgi:hypothetical protein
MLFSNGFLYKYQIENIHKVAREMLTGFSDEYLISLDKYIESIFKLWQLERGRKPNNTLGGLLGYKLDQNNAEPLTVEECQNFKPWQCAGISVNNDIDLAFHLWLDDYDKFNGLVKDRKMENILAVLLLKTEDPSHSNSIFRAYDYILNFKLWKLEAHLEFYADYKNKYKEEKLKAEEQLALARKVAASKKTQRSNKYKSDWDYWAYETLKANPLWKLEAIAEHVHKIAASQNHTMANGQPYQLSYIRESLKGFKARFRVSEHKNS